MPHPRRNHAAFAGGRRHRHAAPARCLTEKLSREVVSCPVRSSFRTRAPAASTRQGSRLPVAISLSGDRRRRRRRRGGADRPFVDQMNPDASTLAAMGPVDIDISKIQPGEQIVALWAAKPVFVLNRPQAALDELRDPKHIARLLDPNSENRQQPATRPTGVVRSNPSSWFSLASAPISAAFRCSSRSQIRPPRPQIGPAAFSAPATLRNTTSRAGCSGRPCALQPAGAAPSLPRREDAADQEIRLGKISTSARFCRFEAVGPGFSQRTSVTNSKAATARRVASRRTRSGYQKKWATAPLKPCPSDRHGPKKWSATTLRSPVLVSIAVKVTGVDDALRFRSGAVVM